VIENSEVGGMRDWEEVIKGLLSEVEDIEFMEIEDYEVEDVISWCDSLILDCEDYEGLLGVDYEKGKINRGEYKKFKEEIKSIKKRMIELKREIMKRIY